jgi:Domain of unknown function (DUF4062)/AAA ATPase domain
VSEPATYPDGSRREIRVFVSSTFRDMQEDRDYLVKFTFPELRKLCEARRVTWGEVDLRWGVTDEQVAEGKALSVCLEEIHRCRPYFIGLLGERYGWIPPRISSGLIEQHAWLAEYANRSITELEIVHGVLREPQMQGRAYFYFRDPDHPRESSSEPGSPQAGEAAEAAAKLGELKDVIRQGQAQQICQLRENYRDPQELGEWILQDFTALIDQLFPANEAPDPLTQETADHEAFAESRRRVYVSRQEDFERLDAHVEGNGPPLVVLGESGIGKSALLANWVFHYRALGADAVVLIHFAGATAYSADWAAMLRRLIGELDRHFQTGLAAPDEPEKLRSTFADSLEIASTRGRVILLLDGLNQLEDRDGALDLVWLPPVIPENVRVLLSTLPGRTLDELTNRGAIVHRERARTGGAQAIDSRLSLAAHEEPRRASRGANLPGATVRQSSVSSRPAGGNEGLWPARTAG